MRTPYFSKPHTELAEKRKLVRDTRFGVDWIYEVAKQIAEKAA